MRKPLLNRSFNVIARSRMATKQPLAAAPAKSSWSRKAIGSIAALLVAFLAACGDDSSSGKSEEDSSGIATVATYEDLIHCTKSHYGEIAYVEEENTYFECTSEDWTEVDSAKVDSILTASSSSVAADSSKPKSSSSIKVSEKDTAKVEVKKVDSVTVVGFAQKGPFAKGSSVTVYGLDSLFAKTKTKFTGSVENDSGAFKVSKVALPSQFALVEVSGYYQNEVCGKKSSGSKTTLSALVDLSAGKSVKANVNLFTDLEFVRAKQLILNEKFNVAAAKQRATKELLAAFGSSVKSETTATEISLLDTSSAGKALLAASLLMQGDLSASKFGSRLSGVEDLFSATGALDSAELRAAIADWASKEDSTDNFAKIRENIKSLKIMGVVPDFESTLYAFWIKDYGLGNCTEELESTIKKNENKLSDNYGAGYACTAKRWHKATALDTELGLCTGKMEGQFKEYKGKKDTEYYVCKAGTWKEISETQYELKECTDKRNDEYVKTKSEEYFVCTDKQWLEIDDIAYELKLCTESRKYELAATKKSGSYVCRFDGKVSQWEKATDLEVELGVCGGKDVKDSTIKKSKEGSAFACLSKEWKKTDEVTAELGFCKASRVDSIYKTESNDYYQCNSSGEWVDVKQLAYELQPAGACTEEKNLITFKTETLGLYVCVNKEWREATDLEEELGVCGGKDVVSGVVYRTEAGNRFVCENTSWRDATEQEILVNDLGACTSDNQDTILWTGSFVENIGYGNIPDTKSDGKYYRCNNKSWEESDKIHFIYGATCKSSYSKIYWEIPWASEDGVMDNNKDLFIRNRFFESSKTDYSDEEFEAFINMFVVGDDTLYYALCKDNEWSKITASDFNMRKVCSESALYTIRSPKRINGDVVEAQAYACLESGWTRVHDVEKEHGVCTLDKKGDTLTFNGVKYYCYSDSYLWQKMVLTDSRDKDNVKSYPIVKIDNQFWMAKNLDYKMQLGAAVGDTAGYCYLNDSGTMLCNENFGRYYLDNAKIISEACPDGWHVPDTTEWKSLIDYAGGPEEAWVKLRTVSDWTTGYQTDPLKDDPGTDVYGFSIYPAGYRSSSISYYNKGVGAYFWTSDSKNDTYYVIYMFYTNKSIKIWLPNSSWGVAIRCIRD